MSPNLYTFLKPSKKGVKNLKIMLNENVLYFLIIHIKFSSIFYTSQLSDIFAYETVGKHNLKKQPLTSKTILVYNFHNMMFGERFFIFTTKQPFIKSITEMYPNAAWLEREVSEMHGLNFGGKKDVRNLMLQYGDTSSPFRKSYPSIGRKEMFYDGVNDLIIQSPVSIQI